MLNSCPVDDARTCGEEIPCKGCPEEGCFHDDDPQQTVEEPGPKFIPHDGVRFVNVYFVNRCYGGPEEGGWYWDQYELIETSAVPAADAEALKASKLAGEYGNEGRRPLSSVLSTGEYQVCIEPKPGKPLDPERRPRYE
jgi:hypothetical protein